MMRRDMDSTSTHDGDLSEPTNDEQEVIEELKDEVDMSGEMTRIDPADMDTLTMEVTVDVSDFSDRDKRILSLLGDIYEDAFSEMVAKNRDYSWSFLRTGEKLAASPGTPFDSATRAQAYGLLTRVGDKHERLLENVYGEGSQEVSAPAHETAAEAANYYIFLSFVLEHPELASSFLGE